MQAIGQSLGRVIGLLEHGRQVGDYPIMKSANEVWHDRGGAAARQMFKFAHALLQATGLGGKAPAFHLHFLSKSSSWGSHEREVADLVGGVLSAFQKSAFSTRDALGIGGLMGRGALLGSMAAGGGLGALYWLLSRHANQDESDVNATQQQLDYYRELSRNLDASMRRKFRYDRGPQESAPA